MDYRSKYFECTKDNPWDKTKGEFAKHKDAIEVYDDWEYTRFKCPHCETEWKEYYEDTK